MEENFDALEVIARTRGKVNMDSTPSGDSLFILWGSVTAFFYLLEFLLLKSGFMWAGWLWIGIPLIGCPWMVVILKNDRARTHMRTRISKLVLDYWIFAGCAICLGGFLFDAFGLYETMENPMICLLLGIGSFITGEAVRCRPMIVGGLAGAVMAVGSFVLQGDLWIWQTLSVAVVAISAMVVPGIIYNNRLKHGV